MIFFLIFISFCELKKSKWRNYSVCPNNIIMMFGSRTHKTNWQCGHKQVSRRYLSFWYFVNRNMRFSNSNVLPTSFDCNGCAIGQRTESDRTADGIWSGGERNPIGWRTQSDWVAGAFKGVHLSQVHQQSYQVPNKAVKYPTKLSSAPNSFL